MWSACCKCRDAFDARPCLCSSYNHACKLLHGSHIRHDLKLLFPASKRRWLHRHFLAQAASWLQPCVTDVQQGHDNLEQPVPDAFALLHRLVKHSLPHQGRACRPAAAARCVGPSASRVASAGRVTSTLLQTLAPAAPPPRPNRSPPPTAAPRPVLYSVFPPPVLLLHTDAGAWLPAVPKDWMATSRRAVKRAMHAPCAAVSDGSAAR